MKQRIISMLFCLSAFCAMAQTEAELDSIESSVNLNEVVVTGKRPTAKFTETGLVYDMQADAAVRTMSLLEALRRVPMVTVNAEDEIRVKGSSDYSIYLNGRPYRIAQSDPKSVLNSIPANTIAKIELITELDGRYDAEAGKAIINIITIKNAIDGYTLTMNARVNTKPEHPRVVDATNDGVSFVATKDKVNMMLGYDFVWQNVLNQPMSSHFSFFDKEGKLVRESTTTLKGVDGNYNYHTGRMMFEWTPDTLNSLYVDGHAFFDHNYQNTVSTYSGNAVGEAPVMSYFRSYRSNTSGTAEANIIYRNYYRIRPDLCRLSLGYRFALDPEKAKSDITTSDNEDCQYGTHTLNYVNGHLQEHTINADYSLPLAAGHTLRVGAKDVVRLGRTEPDYLLWNGHGWEPATSSAGDYDGAMRYYQNIAAVYAAYTGWVGKFNLSASVRGEYASNTFRLTGNGKRETYDYFDVVPRVSIVFNQSQTLRYMLTYNTSVTRPGIGQLDPFYNSLYTNLHTQGNPNLRQARTNSVGVSMLKMGQTLIMQLSASVNRAHNSIVDYYTCDSRTGNVLMSSVNFSRRDYIDQSLYIGYEPKNWLSLTLSAGVTENWFRDKHLGKYCFGVDWNLYAAANFTLPHSWTLGAQLMCNRMFNEPYTVYTKTMVMPAFYANKNFMGGKLSVGVTVSSPFAKYNRFGSEAITPQFEKIQHNDILARGFGVKVSYRLSSGKNTRINRDTSLRNDDLDTGVK